MLPVIRSEKASGSGSSEVTRGRNERSLSAFLIWAKRTIANTRFKKLLERGIPLHKELLVGGGDHGEGDLPFMAQDNIDRQELHGHEHF
jgi:hypothetical protein